jgi:hypothetical protein
MWNTQEQTYNIFIVLTLENMDKEGIKNMVIEKGIKKFRKFRSMLTFRFFEWWWQEISIEESLKRIEFIDSKKLGCTIRSKEDLTQWALTELAIKFDIKNELPYKFLIIENQENAVGYQNLLILKFDHCLSDGVSMMNFICAMSDNYSTKLFPATMSKSVSKVYELFAILLLPFNILKLIYLTFVELKPVKTIFKVDKPVTGVAKITLSDKFNLEEYMKFNKQLGITFNDMMITVMSAAAKKYLREKGAEVPDYILVVFPINMKPVPKGLEDIIINNDAAGNAVNIKLIEDVITESKPISRKMSKLLRNFPWAKTNKVMADLMWHYLPFYVARWIVLNVYRKLDLTMSNVPGPREALTYNGHKVLDMIPLFTPGFVQTFIGIMSYAGSFKLTLVNDSSLDIDPNDFMKFLVDELHLLKSRMLTEGTEGVPSHDSKKSV